MPSTARFCAYINCYRKPAGDYNLFLPAGVWRFRPDPTPLCAQHRRLLTDYTMPIYNPPG